MHVHMSGEGVCTWVWMLADARGFRSPAPEWEAVLATPPGHCDPPQQHFLLVPEPSLRPLAKLFTWRNLGKSLLCKTEWYTFFVQKHGISTDSCLKGYIFKSGCHLKTLFDSLKVICWKIRFWILCTVTFLQINTDCLLVHLWYLALNNFP